MKKLKVMLLGLFSICSVIMYYDNVNAEDKVIKLDKDMTSSELQSQISDGTVIDGQNKYKITGGLVVNNGMNVTVKNVTLDGEGKTQILLDLRGAGKVTVENVTFNNYTSKGIYTNELKELNVYDSTFDASYAKDLETGNELVKRSAAGIDINFGDFVTKDFNVGDINIEGNTFKNVVDSEPVEKSTAGAIKAKIKDNRHLKSIGTIKITNNVFENNVRDLVIGTNDPTADAGMEAIDTGMLDFIIKYNGTIKVGNNTNADKKVENYEGNYIINFAKEAVLKLNDKTNENNEMVKPNEINSDKFNDVKNNDLLDGITIDYEKYSITIKKENIKDDLSNVLTDLSMDATTKSKVEELKKYEKEGVLFISTTKSGELPASLVNVSMNVGSDYEGKTYLYYFNEKTQKLELVSEVNVKDGVANFDLTHYSDYVLSTTSLLSNSSTPEKVPNTYDGILTYIILGALAVVSLGLVTFKIRKKVSA